ncbi:MAG: tRNA pseudouridine(38-40) synthase TruA [Bryobacteraceae bacterium]
MRRLRFHVAYDGTDFHGWQVQPGLPTIQGILEEVIGTVEGKPVHVLASGRTDAGVHAVAQVAAVSINNPVPPDNLRRAVNRLLPRSIRVSHVAEDRPDFHPRFDARRKTYQYRVFREEICPPFDWRYVYYHPYPLDESAMIEAAPLFEGTHDFTAFAAKDDTDALGGSRVRTVFRSTLTRSERVLTYSVTGSGFLKHMVRNMVGVLLEVGKGNMSRDEVLERLTSVGGFRPGPTVPPSGLFLMSVEYE